MVEMLTSSFAPPADAKDVGVSEAMAALWVICSNQMFKCGCIQAIMEH